MARPRTPTNVLDARGAFKKNPQRRRSEPDAGGPIGAPPDDLSQGARLAWERIVRIAPAGVLTEADQMMLQLASELWAEWAVAPTEFAPAKMTRLEAQLGKFGLAPSDRAKLSIQKAPKDDNPYAALDK